MEMRIIKLDASQWSNIIEFYDAVCAGIGAPSWHGRSLNAFIDSMVYGGINEIDTPYKIVFVGTAKASDAIRSDIHEFIEAINNAQGSDNQIDFEICE